VEDWSDPIANQYGAKAITRFGLGILRSNDKAKMTNISTTTLVGIKKYFFPHSLLKRRKQVTLF
jgi:hypothetical protein